MKKLNRWRYLIFFVAGGTLLQIFAVFSVVAASGRADGGLGTFPTLIIYLATWPSLAAGVPRYLVVSELIYLAFNVGAYAIIGVALSLVIGRYQLKRS